MKEPREKRPRFEIEPPQPARCPACKGKLRVSYTTLYRESGFRRVMCDCQGCGAICFWDEDLKAEVEG